MRRRLLLANSQGGGWSEKTLAFYIDSIAYTAYEGMTWGDWITSEFNVDAFYIREDGQVWNTEGAIYYAMARIVLERDYIIADYRYYYKIK